jgi:hypothetical protein
METTQSVFSRLKSADNKQLWAFAQELVAANKKVERLEKVKTPKEKPITKPAIIDLEDKEGLRQKVLEHLFVESGKGNAQASDKLARLAGLGEETQDIIIEIVNYDDVKKSPKKVRKKSTTKK